MFACHHQRREAIPGGPCRAPGRLPPGRGQPLPPAAIPGGDPGHATPAAYAGARARSCLPPGHVAGAVNRPGGRSIRRRSWTRPDGPGPGGLLPNWRDGPRRAPAAPATVRDPRHAAPRPWTHGPAPRPWTHGPAPRPAPSRGRYAPQDATPTGLLLPRNASALRIRAPLRPHVTRRVPPLAPRSCDRVTPRALSTARVRARPLSRVGTARVIFLSRGRCDPAISLVFLFFLLISFTRDVMCEALARVRARIIRNNKKRQSGFDPFPPFLKMKSFDLVFSFLAPREYATKHTAYKDVFRFGFEMIRPWRWQKNRKANP